MVCNADALSPTCNVDGDGIVSQALLWTAAGWVTKEFLDCAIAKILA